MKGFRWCKATTALICLVALVVSCAFIACIPVTLVFKDGESVIYTQKDVSFFTNLEKNADGAPGSEYVYGDDRVRYKFEYNGENVEFINLSWFLRYSIIKKVAVNLFTFKWSADDFVIELNRVDSP